MGEIITETTTVSNFKPDETLSVKDESFKGKYTTAEKAEPDKIVLSNDFYMLGQYLETIINKMVK